ncbi:hypothetical protein HZH68_013859 [Vespula germanica]|uniref:Uncharacterized protein n=1 Tax=Vespula germanica TaxID=30212 RepID=A0A834MVR2_VESGE|nr:hypothetical protein HZH68_013859 [Vespula germanica]
MEPGLLSLTEVPNTCGITARPKYIVAEGKRKYLTPEYHKMKFYCTLLACVAAGPLSPWYFRIGGRFVTMVTQAHNDLLAGGPEVRHPSHLPTHSKTTSLNHTLPSILDTSLTAHVPHSTTSPMSSVVLLPSTLISLQ